MSKPSTLRRKLRDRGSKTVCSSSRRADTTRLAVPRTRGDGRRKSFPSYGGRPARALPRCTSPQPRRGAAPTRDIGRFADPSLRAPSSSPFSVVADATAQRITSTTLLARVFGRNGTRAVLCGRRMAEHFAVTWFALGDRHGVGRSLGDGVGRSARVDCVVRDSGVRRMKLLRRGGRPNACGSTSEGHGGEEHRDARESRCDHRHNRETTSSTSAPRARTRRAAHGPRARCTSTRRGSSP